MSDCLPVSAAPAPPSSSSQSIQDLDDVASMEEEELIAAEVSQDDELLDVESAMTDATEEDDFEASPLPSGASAASTSNRPARGHQRYNSAESIALSLLQAGVGANEPKVADLEWLVGDGDTPQKVRVRITYVHFTKRFFRHFHSRPTFRPPHQPRGLQPPPPPFKTQNSATAPSFAARWTGRRPEPNSYSRFTRRQSKCT